MSKKSPQLRFEGFTDDWEERKFSNLAEVRRGLTYKPSDVQKYGIRVLRSSNIAEDTFLIKSDDVFVNKEAVKIDKVKNGDILITSANGSSRLVGKHALIEGIENDTVHGGFMLVARAEKPEFVNAIMSSSWYSKFINIFVSGGNGAIGNLSKSNLEDQKVYVPSEIEQTKIGLFFKGLDDTIALHQRKLDLLKEQKKGYLQKMFPKNGAKVPELRFAGFADDWEERKLEDIFLYKQGQQVPVENQFTKPGKHRHRFIRIVDLTTTDEEPRYIEYSGHNTISATDLFMIRYGQPGVIGYGYEGVIANNLFKLIPKVKANNRFFKYRLDSMYPKIQSLSSSTTMPAISFKSLDVLDVRYPDIKEQEKIGAFFKQLDDTIALHQRKLDLLKEQKKGFLQKMFV